MEYIYFCKRCKGTYSVMGKYSKKNCPECSTELFATEFPLEEWVTKSDEEKALLKQKFDSYQQEYVNYSRETSERVNSIGRTLTALGWIYIVLTIIGAIIMIKYFGIVTAIIAGFFGCLCGVLLLAFAEIVNLLQDIKNK